MARVKRFTNADNFLDELTCIIDNLIAQSNQLPDIEKNDLKIIDIALEFGVTPNTLRRWCHEYTKLSAKQFLSLYRIEKAKILLKNGLKPSVVAQQLAFTQHKVFSTVFKQVTNKTPKTFQYYSNKAKG